MLEDRSASSSSTYTSFSSNFNTSMEMINSNEAIKCEEDAGNAVKNLRNSKELWKKLGQKIRRAGLIRDHQIWTLYRGIRVYKDSFKGEDFVAWLMREQNLSRSEALDKGHCLMELGVVEPIIEQKASSAVTPTTPSDFLHNSPKITHADRSFSTERYYKLAEDEHDQRLPLNGPTTVEEHCLLSEHVGQQQAAAAAPLVGVRDFNERFCAIVDRIYAKILSEDKQRVHLDQLDECESFAEYLELAKEAVRLDIHGANKKERLAVFINLHNMMLVHITYKFGLPGTIWQRRKYLYSCYYTIGAHLYSLQSIFNGILRGNRKGLGMLWKSFGEQDYRNQFTIEGGEPLVHFGLNNYTRSTPPIRTYSTENVYEELRNNARECLCNKKFMQIDIKRGKISVGKLFKQYAEDFGQSPDDVVKWLIRTLERPSDASSQLSRMLYTKNYALAYLPMDTDLNMSYGVAQSNNNEKSSSGNLDNNVGGGWTPVKWMGQFGGDGGEEEEIEEE